MGGERFPQTLELGIIIAHKNILYPNEAKNVSFHMNDSSLRSNMMNYSRKSDKADMQIVTEITHFYATEKAKMEVVCMFMFKCPSYKQFLILSCLTSHSLAPRN